MSYSIVDLEFAKPSKRSLEKVLCIEKMALRTGWKSANFAYLLKISPSFLPVWLFIYYGQIHDVIWCKLMYYDVKMIKNWLKDVDTSGVGGFELNESVS